MQVLEIFKPCKYCFLAKCSETKYVHARLKPDVAIVIKNKYTDITRPNKPIASAPILFDTYMLKAIETVLIIIEVIVNISPFIINFFTISPFNFMTKY